MESYTQPWTVVNKYEQYQSEPKTTEYYPTGVEALYKKPHYETSAYEKPEGQYKNEYCPKSYSKGHYSYKPESYYRGEQTERYYQVEKPEYCGGKYEKPQGLYNGDKTERYYQGEKPEYCGGKYEKTERYYQGEKPEYCGGKYEKTERYYQGEKPEYCGGKWGKPEGHYKGEKPVWNKSIENICGEWEKVCESFERCQVEQGINYEGQSQKSNWRCSGKKCCDVEMVNLVKDMIHILMGAEQSYIQLGFLCMDEKFTLVNTSEYFRLCGLRMHWLANGLISKSVRLFNVNEWINNTTFENFFKVPTKEELATNDYTSIIKTFFKIAMDAETRLVERMAVLGEKMMKTDWVNSECRFEGFKWFINFVLPYQTHFVREMSGHYRNIEMCNNGFIFDKCEMYPLVQKIEEFINRITKVNTTGFPVWEKNGIVPVKKW